MSKVYTFEEFMRKRCYLQVKITTQSVYEDKIKEKRNSNS